MNHSLNTQNLLATYGMLMPNRHESAGSGYRYGFNGMEEDAELKGKGNSYDFGARLYDSRVGRWFSTDYFEFKYSGLSPYNYAANNPISFYDVDGKDIIFIIKETREEEGKEIVITHHLNVIDNREQLDKLAPGLMEAYDIARVTPTGDKVLGEFETSTTDDVYFMIGKERALGHEGHTSYDIDKDRYGNPLFKDYYRPEGEENVMWLESFDRAFCSDGDLVVDPNRRVSLIDLNALYYTEVMIEIFIDDIATTLIHEVLFHISYANDGLTGDEQHDKAFGTTSDVHKGLRSNAQEGSPQKQIEAEVDAEIEKRDTGNNKTSQPENDGN